MYFRVLRSKLILSYAGAFGFSIICYNYSTMCVLFSEELNIFILITEVFICRYYEKVLRPILGSYITLFAFFSHYFI